MRFGRKNAVDERNTMTDICYSDLKRIADDASIAIRALMAIRNEAHGTTLHSDYLKEKIKTVKNCIEFMENFYE